MSTKDYKRLHCHRSFLIGFMLAFAIVGLYSYVATQMDVFHYRQRDGELNQYQIPAEEVSRDQHLSNEKHDTSQNSVENEEINDNRNGDGGDESDGENGEVLSSSTNANLFLRHCQPDDVWRLRNASEISATSIEPVFYRVKSASSWRDGESKFKCERYPWCTDLYLPKTALLSFPRSGNSWTRHLIEMLTGLPTGGVYKPLTRARRKELNITRRKGSIFHCSSHTKGVVLIKDHGPSFKIVSNYSFSINYDKLLLLLRNPFKSFISYYQLRELQGDPKQNIEFDETSMAWDRFIRETIPMWKQFVEIGVKSSVPKIVVFHEELSSNLLPELIRIAQFLRADKVQDFAFCCVLSDAEGAFHKKPNAFYVSHFYSTEQISLLNTSIDEVVKSLKKSNPGIAKYLSSYKMPTQDEMSF